MHSQNSYVKRHGYIEHQLIPMGNILMGNILMGRKRLLMRIQTARLALLGEIVLQIKKAKTTDIDNRPNSLNDGAAAKPFYWKFSHSKDCPITKDPDSVAHLVRYFKPSGCPLPSLQNMMERDAYIRW